MVKPPTAVSPVPECLQSTPKALVQPKRPDCRWTSYLTEDLKGPQVKGNIILFQPMVLDAVGLNENC
jgi:hypothetical protein